MRGLKQYNFTIVSNDYSVALFASAWIETLSTLNKDYGLYVALFASAWIETIKNICVRVFRFVALFASAWIETRDI